MGDPKSQRRKYTKPTHPWEGDRIESEDEYVRKYGLKNKREFWKAESFLRDQRAQARSYLPLVLRDDPQGTKEADQLVGKLNRLGILEADANLDDVLALDVDAILSRRLQTITYLKGLANTPDQARQFIVHGHIAIGNRKVTVPGKLVESIEEQAIQYAPGSPLNNPAHPLRGGSADGEIPGGPGAGPDEVEPEPETEDVDTEPDTDAEAEPETDEAEDADEAEEPDAPESEDETDEADEPDADEGEEPEEDEAEEPEEDEAEEPEADAEDDAEAADEADDADEADTEEADAEEPKEGDE